MSTVFARCPCRAVVVVGRGPARRQASLSLSLSLSPSPARHAILRHGNHLVSSRQPFHVHVHVDVDVSRRGVGAPKSTSRDDDEFSAAPWEVLGVEPDSSEKAIKAAHRRLVLEHHPDRVLGESGGKAGAETQKVQRRFMRIQEAYEMLMGRRHVHMGSSQEQDGWNFHDFFWSFNYHRRKKEGARKQPRPAAGSWRGQMENLKRRAAARKWKKARQGRQGRRESEDGWFGNIMNMKAGGEAGGEAGADTQESSKAVSDQLEGLRRKASLKKAILSDDE